MSRKNQLKNKLIFLTFFILAALVAGYSLSWGLPLPFHPDERNMALAVLNLKCSSFLNCLHPNFFAYGQFPLYFSYFFIKFLKFLRGDVSPITFTEAVIGLRSLSVLASLGYVFVLLRVFEKVNDLNKSKYFFGFLLVFSPFFIQFSHFGTTEAVLMFTYTVLVYISLNILHSKKIRSLDLLKTGFVLGLGIASKISAASFILVPAIALILREKNLKKILFPIALILGYAVFISFFLSPYSFLDFRSFFHSLSYEIGVAQGKFKVFYTKQFDWSLPILFQVFLILPYSLGFVSVILLIISLVKLPNTKEFLFLKLSFLLFFFSQAVLYTKWTRFIAPVFPLGFLLSFVVLSKFKNRWIKILLGVLMFLQGFGFFMVYVKEDPRFAASRWMIANIPSRAVILTETANVVDLPVFKSPVFYYPNYEYYSFNFYDLDVNPILQVEFKRILARADYIIVPSRRVFLNHTCEYPRESFVHKFFIVLQKFAFQPGYCEKRKKAYPILNWYYKNLFNGKLGFRLVAEFENYPRFLFIPIIDELAEETVTVFDHPVVRIYKRN